MMRYLFIIFTIAFSLNTFAKEPGITLDNSGFKRIELGMGLIYGEVGYGAKVKYQLSDYLVGFELNSVDLSESYLFGPQIRDNNNEAGDYWLFSASIGKDWSNEWSNGWLNAAVDIGIGYGIEGNHTNCTDIAGSGSFLFSPTELCDFEVERAISIPVSATFVIGKGLGIGLSLTYAISSLGNNTGLKIVVPLGSFN